MFCFRSRLSSYRTSLYGLIIALHEPSSWDKDWETVDFGYERCKEYYLIAHERVYVMDFLLSLDKDRFRALLICFAQQV